MRLKAQRHKINVTGGRKKKKRIQYKWVPELHAHVGYLLGFTTQLVDYLNVG